MEATKCCALGSFICFEKVVKKNMLHWILVALLLLFLIAVAILYFSNKSLMINDHSMGDVINKKMILKNGTVLNYQVWSTKTSNRKPIVRILFICGWATNWWWWISQVEKIEQLQNDPHFQNSSAFDYEIVVYDHRGCGQSSDPNGLLYGPKLLAEETVELVQKLRWNGGFHIVCQSMGGLIGKEVIQILQQEHYGDLHVESIAIQNSFQSMWSLHGFPQLTTILFAFKMGIMNVLKNIFHFKINTVHLILEQMFSNDWLHLETYKSARHHHFDQNKMRNLERCHEVFQHMFFGKEFHLRGAIKQLLGMVFYHMNANTLSNLILKPQHTLEHNRLLCIPILFIASKRDKMVRFSNSVSMFETIRSAFCKRYPYFAHLAKDYVQFHVFEKAGHISNVEHQHEFNRLIFEEWIPFIEINLKR